MYSFTKGLSSQSCSNEGNRRVVNTIMKVNYIYSSYGGANKNQFVIFFGFVITS